LFEGMAKDFTDEIIDAASKIVGKDMVWSPAARKIAQDEDFMDFLRASANKYFRSKEERDDMIQDFFLKSFGPVLKTAASSIKAGKYTGKQFYALIATTLRNMFVNRYKKQRSQDKGMVKGADFSQVADKKVDGLKGSDRAKIRDALAGVISKMQDADAKRFLDSYFGLSKGRLSFSGGKKTDALKSSGLGVTPQNQVRATRWVAAAMDALRGNRILQKMAEERGMAGDLQSKMVVLFLSESMPCDVGVIGGWLDSILAESEG